MKLQRTERGLGDEKRSPEDQARLALALAATSCRSRVTLLDPVAPRRAAFSSSLRAAADISFGFPSDCPLPATGEADPASQRIFLRRLTTVPPKKIVCSPVLGTRLRGPLLAYPIDPGWCKSKVYTVTERNLLSSETDQTCARWGQRRSGWERHWRSRGGVGFDSARNGFDFALLDTRLAQARTLVRTDLVGMIQVRAEAALNKLFIDRIHRAGRLVIANTITDERPHAMPTAAPVLAFRVVFQAPGTPLRHLPQSTMGFLFPPSYRNIIEKSIHRLSARGAHKRAPMMILLCESRIPPHEHARRHRLATEKDDHRRPLARTVRTFLSNLHGRNSTSTTTALSQKWDLRSPLVATLVAVFLLTEDQEQISLCISVL